MTGEKASRGCLLAHPCPNVFPCRWLCLLPKAFSSPQKCTSGNYTTHWWSVEDSNCLNRQRTEKEKPRLDGSRTRRGFCHLGKSWIFTSAAFRDHGSGGLRCRFHGVRRWTCRGSIRRNRRCRPEDCNGRGSSRPVRCSMSCRWRDSRL